MVALEPQFGGEKTSSGAATLGCNGAARSVVVANTRDIMFPNEGTAGADPCSSFSGRFVDETSDIS
ncbi:hypothetical protein TanjilG_23135 [Lupinus angustifolius]|uniref:Uncharacterized protein n=1 Tax=Lupinus angustifolius TaxID=3871 RepID=A0A1J7FPL4_LUPAN|nr:hypothetical protein TanjilG_23135 [Lupinus angustifolius]